MHRYPPELQCMHRYPLELQCMHRYAPELRCACTVTHRSQNSQGEANPN
jgi:hypothetical protein